MKIYKIKTKILTRGMRKSYMPLVRGKEWMMKKQEKKDKSEMVGYESTFGKCSSLKSIFIDKMKRFRFNELEVCWNQSSGEQGKFKFIWEVSVVKKDGCIVR